MRDAKFNIFLGVPGSGKTTMMKKIMKTRKRVLIVTLDFPQWQSHKTLNVQHLHKFEGVYKIQYHKQLIQYLDYYKLRNCMLVLDDMRTLKLRSVKEQEALETMVNVRRHRMLDVIIGAHGFKQIKPRSLFSYEPELVLFRTSDTIATVKNELQNPKHVESLQKRVNKKSLSNRYYFEVAKLSELGFNADK